MEWWCPAGAAGGAVVVISHFAGPCEMPRWNKHLCIIKLLPATTLDAVVLRQNCMNVGG